MVATTFDYRDDGAIVLTFGADQEAFFTQKVAQTWLHDRGFSVGAPQENEPRGIRYGDILISKWRGLAPIERDVLHGVMTGDQRRGPIKIEIYGHTPADVREAFVAAPTRREIKTSAPEGRGAAVTPAALIFLCLFALWALMTRDTVLLPGPPIAKSTLRLEPYGSARMEARR